jgi:hypothetical protein
MMKTLHWSKRLVLSLACAGLLLPPADVLAAGPKVAQRAPAKPAVTDVALHKGGIVVGHLVDEQGKPIDGAQVSIRLGNKEIAQTTTDNKGMFGVRNLRGGVYQVTAGQGSGTYRFWAPETAPPTAKKRAVLVANEQVARAQVVGGVDVITGGLIILSAVGVGYGISNNKKIDDLSDQIDNQPPVASQ